MKDSKSLLLGLLAIGLIGTWVYHLFDKSRYAGMTREVYVKDSTAVAEAIRDSLQKMYTHTITQLGTEKVNADSIRLSLKGELGERMREINQLRNDIGLILRKTNLTHSDLASAKTKIRDLQTKVNQMTEQNESLSQERSRLNSILDELNKEMIVLQSSMEKVSDENKQLAKTLSEAATFVASELRIAAMNLRSEEKEVETNSVKKADKFVISFVVQNHIRDFPGAELLVAITDPNGKILVGEGWNPGHFEMKNGSRKEFTRKVRFEYSRGEQKRLIFSVQTEKFHKGVYTLNIYHNGVMIGESSWMLT